MTAFRSALVACLATVWFIAGCSSTPEQRTESVPVAPQAPPGPLFGTIAVSPNAGTGREQVFTVTLTRAAGAPPPALIGLLVNKAVIGSNGCYAFREIPTNRTLLVNDTGIGSKELGKARSISNSQCDIIGDSTAPVVTDSAITVQVHMKFRPGFDGSKNLYVIAQDRSGNSAGLQPIGQFTIQ